MEQRDFDELVNQARQIAKQLGAVYRDVTGEDLDLEGIVRHYPLIAVGIAAGAGALGGWLAARRAQRRLPPPPSSHKHTPLEYIERLLPQGVERAREMLPDVVSEEVAERAEAWVEEVLQPRLKEGVESVMANMSETRWGLYLRQTIERLESGEDRQLEDPE